MARILRLNLSGVPTSWLTREQAAMLYAKNLVKWELGETPMDIFGGTNRSGEQSKMALSPVIATAGEVYSPGKLRSLNNRMLFRRDSYRCMYCGDQFVYGELTRDHVMPRGQGGKDMWENVVAACKRCNHSKGNRTPEQAHLQLLAVPFAPNVFERMYLSQHVILADQMEYLEKRFSGQRLWCAA